MLLNLTFCDFSASLSGIHLWPYLKNRMFLLAKGSHAEGIMRVRSLPAANLNPPNAGLVQLIWSKMLHHHLNSMVDLVIKNQKSTASSGGKTRAELYSPRPQQCNTRPDEKTKTTTYTGVFCSRVANKIRMGHMQAWAHILFP